MFRRRDVLLGGAALGAFGVVGCGPARIPLAIGEAAAFPVSTAFPLGVASGEVSHERAVLWTRYVGSAPLSLTVLPDDGGPPVVVRRPVGVAGGGFAHEIVDGLSPGTMYRYVFEEDVDTAPQQMEGVFRAAIDPLSTERLVFTASACSRNGMDFSVLTRAAERADVDLHILLGDTSYNDGARTLDEYRDKWAENLSRPEYRLLRSRTSVLATWDDHEVRNDWSGAEMDPELVQNGMTAFFEHTPVSRSGDAPNRLWRNVRWGRTAEFFVLDGRSERRPGTRGTAQAEYLSTAQFEWLEQGLLASTARFKVIINSVPIGTFPGIFQAFQGDRWEGYAAQRDRLLSLIKERSIGGVFFVSGDFHMASMGRVSTAGPGDGLVEILAGPVAARSPNPAMSFLARPQFSFTTNEPNVGVFHLDPATGEVQVSWVGRDGTAIAQHTFQP